MKFVFKAKNQVGELREGRIDAIDRGAAVALLQKKGFVPLTVAQEKKREWFLEDLQRAWEGMGQKDLMQFFRELATMIDSSVPVLPSLRAIEEQSENRFVQSVVKDIANDIEDGMPFSESLAKYPKVFSLLIVSMVRSGEVSGNLQKSISSVADNIEQNYELTSKIRGALIYPAFVITASFILGLIVVSFILPRLTDIIKELNVVVPWYTTAMIAIGDFMQFYWWAVVIVFVSAIGALIYYIRTDSGQDEWDQIKIRLPIIGKLFRQIYIVRFAENLSILLAGGIPIVRALQVVSDVVNNTVYRKLILQAAEEVRSGGDISTVFTRYPGHIPTMMTRIIRIGEETGTVSDVLGRMPRFYRREIDQTARNLSTLIEPILIVILGIFVGVLVFSVLLPIYYIAVQF